MQTTLRHMNLRNGLLLLVMLMGLPVAATPQWQLIKEDRGIKVYTAPAGRADFKSIKAVAVFEGTVEKFQAILLDVGRQPAWVYGTRQAYLVKKVSNQEILYYVETQLPWPAANRDAVIRMKIKGNPATNTLTVSSVGEPQALPRQEKKVRVPHFAAQWEIKGLSKNRISITYLLELDPGGRLPPWMVNLFISKGPYETFRNLAGLLKKAP
jgi:hypothetical protein